jgi:RNA polymerase sigma factor (TIGR02999 family)
MAGERTGHSLQATALVHEAYLRLVDGKAVAWHDRAHFLAVSARVMRRILVDHARSRRYQKRGGHARGARMRLSVSNGMRAHPATR